MSKGKPRHNPDKPQNKYGSQCPYAEEHSFGIICEGSFGNIEICKGNRHNCVKTFYKRLAGEKK